MQYLISKNKKLLGRWKVRSSSNLLFAPDKTQTNKTNQENLKFLSYYKG